MKLIQVNGNETIFVVAFRDDKSSSLSYFFFCER